MRPKEQRQQGEEQALALAGSMEAKHLTVELDYYQKKAEKLKNENDTLRSKAFEMEERLRRKAAKRARAAARPGS